MKVTHKPIGRPTPFQVSLPQGKQICLDLDEELYIDINNMRTEILNQASKSAMWSVVTELSLKRVKNSAEQFFKLESEGEDVKVSFSKLTKVCSQHELVCEVDEAFENRKQSILRILEGDNHNVVLQDYHKNLSRLRAVLERYAR